MRKFQEEMEKIYICAMKNMSADNYRDYQVAAELFGQILNYKDSKQLQEKCLEIIEQLQPKAMEFVQRIKKEQARNGQTSIFTDFSQLKKEVIKSD